jgi:hypothetical protein
MPASLRASGAFGSGTCGCWRLTGGLGPRQGHPAHDVRLGVRILAAQQGVDPHEGRLPVERLEQVGQEQEVLLRGEAVGRVAPGSIREDAGLVRLDHRREPVPDSLEVVGAGLRPRAKPERQPRGGGGIRPKCRFGVHPVRKLGLVEPEHVVSHQLRGREHVAHQAPVRRDLDAERVLHRPHGGERVDGGARPADALGEEPGIPGVTPAQDRLEVAEHGGGCPRRAHRAAGGFGLDAQVTVGPREGIDHDPGHVSAPRGRRRRCPCRRWPPLRRWLPFRRWRSDRQRQPP